MSMESRLTSILSTSWAFSLIILLTGCQMTLLDGRQIDIASENAIAMAASPSEGDGDEDSLDSTTAESDDDMASVDVANYASYDESYDEAYAASEFIDVPLDERILDSIFGEMTWFVSERYDFAILRPAPWEEIGPEECSSPGATVCFVGGPGGMIITEERLTLMPRDERSREGYIDFLFEIFGDDSDFEIVQFAESQSAQGDPVDIFTVSSQEDEIMLDRFIFVDEESRVAFNATIFMSAEMHETLTPAIAYIHDSFRFWADQDRTESAITYIDEGRWLASNEEYGAAIVSFSRAIELDPNLRIAYQSRGWLYQQEKRFDSALADLNRVIELAPKLGSAYHDRGLIYYLMHQYDQALIDLEMAIEFEPENASHNNLRALVHALNGDPDSALDDMDDALEKSDGELPIHIQDTRGFVYLMLGEFEKAKDDYDGIFAQEEQFGHALVGAGIAYANVGEIDNGIALIEAGIAEFEDDELEDPEPQLGALLEMAADFLDEE